MKRKFFALALLFCALTPTWVDINQQRNPNIYTVTSSGTVALGCRGLIFIFSSDFAGTISTGKATFTGAADSSIQIPVNARDWLGPVQYTITAGSIRICEVR